MDSPDAMEAVALLLAHYPLQGQRVPDESVMLMVHEFEVGCETREEAKVAVKTCSEWYENIPSVPSIRRAIRHVPTAMAREEGPKESTEEEQRQSQEAAAEVFAAYRRRKAGEKHGGQRDTAVDGDAGRDEEGAGPSEGGQGPGPGGSGPAEGPESGPDGTGAGTDGDAGEGGPGQGRP